MAQLTSTPLWTNPDVELFHGTVDIYSTIITKNGISLAQCRKGTDFGPGFYTTTLKIQAQYWARQRAKTLNVGLARKHHTLAKPIVLVYRAKLASLAGLEALCFVRGHRDMDQFWSFVEHCRRGAIDHGRPQPNCFYDVVYGPVAAFWTQRSAMQDSDQIGFHTAKATAALGLIREESV